MTEPQRRQKILIVDEDLGFVLWLGQILAELGHQGLPAFSWDEADSNTRRLKFSVDVVICNPYLTGTADRLAALAQVNQPLRVVLAEDPAFEAPSSMAGYATLSKPTGSEHISHQDWLVKVEQALADAVPYGQNAKRGRAS